MARDREESGGPTRLLIAMVLVATAVGGALDIVLDAPERTGWSAHVFYELALLTAAMMTSAALWHGWWRERRSLLATRHLLDERRAERDAWRASAEEALAGLSRAIDDRLRAWGLTPAERDIAVLLLEGMSHKQIAAATHRSERTVRQHAVTVYQKSGLRGRAELAAFFLAGLTLPGAAGESARQASDMAHAGHL